MLRGERQLKNVLARWRSSTEIAETNALWKSILSCGKHTQKLLCHVAFGSLYLNQQKIVQKKGHQTYHPTVWRFGIAFFPIVWCTGGPIVSNLVIPKGSKMLTEKYTTHCNLWHFFPQHKRWFSRFLLFSDVQAEVPLVSYIKVSIKFIYQIKKRQHVPAFGWILRNLIVNLSKKSG